jgi:hypothetical protein
MFDVPALHDQLDLPEVASVRGYLPQSLAYLFHHFRFCHFQTSHRITMTSDPTRSAVPTISASIIPHNSIIYLKMDFSFFQKLALSIEIDIMVKYISPDFREVSTHHCPSFFLRQNRNRHPIINITAGIPFPGHLIPEAA